MQKARANPLGPLPLPTDYWLLATSPKTSSSHSHTKSSAQPSCSPPASSLPESSATPGTPARGPPRRGNPIRKGSCPGAAQGTPAHGLHPAPSSSTQSPLTNQNKSSGNPT